MAVGVCLGWLPFAGRPLSPDEAGYLIVGGQWAEGQQPVRRLLGGPAAGAHRDLRAGRRTGRHGAAAAAGGARGACSTVVLSGVLGRLAAPERRSAPLLTAGDGGGLRGHAAVRRQRGQRRAARAAVPGRRDGGVRRRGGQPLLDQGVLAARSWPARPVRSPRWSSRACVDVFVLATVPGCSPAAQRAAGCRASSLGAVVATVCLVVAAAWARGTVPADLWDAVVTFRLDAARELADDSGNAPFRLGGLLGALAASGVPLVVAAFLWKGRGRAVRAGAVDRARPAPRGVRRAHVRAVRSRSSAAATGCTT